jgi:sigma-B regulation protein RsbU (phosphoserine phosphatase)
MSARILVVDDEPGMVRAVERVLSEDYEVVGSRSSTDAVSIASAFRPELAILDIRMPNVDGYELMARLKADLPGLDFILMTGSVDDLDQKLVRAMRSRAFYFIQKPFDREVLRTLVERCLELRWRREEHRRHLHRLEREMEEARAFQRGLLPEAETILNRVALCCRYEPCSDLGGDLYDYAGSSGRTAVLVADVSGHGVSAAMLTGIVKSAFHASHVDGHDPRSVVQRVWTGLTAFSAERFVTLVAALLAPAERCLTYVNAGHPPPVLWSRTREPLWLASTGPLVSPALTWSSWEARAIPIEDGDRLLLYTDGVSEVLAENDGRAETRFQRLLTQSSTAGGPALLDAIVAEVVRDLSGNPQPDDLTLVTATVLPPQ